MGRAARRRPHFIGAAQPGSPADRAGLRPYDIVVGVNGTAVRQSGDLRRALRAAGAGAVVQLQVVRVGAGRFTATPRLGAREVSQQ